MTENPFTILGSPIKLGPKKAKNRIWMTAHATLLVKDHLFTDAHIAYYAERARGGAAVITMEAMATHPTTQPYKGKAFAFDPRMKVGDLIAEPLRIHLDISRSECQDRTEILAQRVRLSTDFLNRTPSALSGGQLQRVCIARAIATNPKLIVLDEPTSSLDLSVRAGILELLQELRVETEAGFLFISHDLGTIKLISDRIAVLYLGHIVEEVPKDKLFSDPSHPYSQSLLSAHLPSDPNARLRRLTLQGEIPSPINLPSGCSFHTRCPVALPACKSTSPKAEEISANHLASCLRLHDGSNIIPRDQK